MNSAGAHGMAGHSRADVLLRGVRDNRIYANEVEMWAMHAAILWLDEIGLGREDVTPRDLTADDSLFAEFAAATQMTPHAAQAYLANAADLRWRLPRLRIAMQAQDVPVWKARQIASMSHGLSDEAAAYLDEHLEGRAATWGPTRLQRLIGEAEAHCDPAEAEARVAAAAEHRKVTAFPSAAATGMVDVAATLDHGDADDLEAAIAMVAAELADLARSRGASDVEPLDIRRARALGVIARRQLAGALDAAGEPVTRVLHAFVHLSEGSTLARVEKGNALVPVDAVARWCAGSQTKVTITPVLDLGRPRRVDGYVPPRAMREQVIVRDRSCVHPFCRRNARVSDVDHIQPYRLGGPPGQTATDNLAPLCRHHHRLKTHAGWSYVMLEPGYYLWRTPAGGRLLRTPEGTIDLESRTPSLAGRLR